MTQTALKASFKKHNINNPFKYLWINRKLMKVVKIIIKLTGVDLDFICSLFSFFGHFFYFSWKNIVHIKLRKKTLVTYMQIQVVGGIVNRQLILISLYDLNDESESFLVNARIMWFICCYRITSRRVRSQ